MDSVYSLFPGTDTSDAAISDSSDVCEDRATCEKSNLKSTGMSGEGRPLVEVDGALNTKSLPESMRDDSD